MTHSDPFVPCVGGLVHDPDGRLLLVQRRNEPGRGLWSIPGGRIEAGETHEAALVREMQEETGLVVHVERLIGVVHRGPFEISDYRCAVVGGELRAGDDALDARWCSASDLTQLPLVAELLETLTGWNVLPQ
ncbi:NUDIX hydrolase [Pseudonocardia sp. TRM90224]|uniref:NUDIX hydrolase n=1 Tax=Pseudonocardia sp. TRM90224 TaxID=2812678 RepID=UPI001E295662|nr:NUDIX domain-containing protein [Pseudonocardia sp. TRM90224]